jgi:hypothetical protein
MAIREGRWDCPQCGHKGNRGSEIKCSACGRVRGQEVGFYLAEDAEEVVDEAARARATAGADGICEYCQATTPASQTHCKSCGAERTEKRREVKVLPDQLEPAAPDPTPKRSSKRGWLVAGAVLLALFGSCLFLFRSKESRMTLEKLSWERQVEVEQYKTVVEEKWRNELPGAARVLSTERRVHHHDKIQVGTRRVSHTVDEQVQTGTRRVKTGTRDLGNGYFEDVYDDQPVYETRQRTVTEDEPVYREDPVYADWCRYEIDKWVPAGVQKASGEDGAARWPDVASGPTQRPGKMTEKYRAIFRDADGKAHEWEPDYDHWKPLRAGEQYRVVTRMGKVTGLAESR